MRPSRPASLAALAAAALACGEANETEGRALASGATCPPGSTLTWETFGRDFFGSADGAVGYCNLCHHSSRAGAARSGAPAAATWDAHDVVRSRAFDIDLLAGSGPDGTFEIMPIAVVPAPDPPQLFPAQEERARLSEWLACGAP